MLERKKKEYINNEKNRSFIRFTRNHSKRSN